MSEMLRDLDLEALRASFESARPFPHVVIDDLIDPAFAAEVAASLPRFGETKQLGDRFESVNEHNKIQVTDAQRLPGPVSRLLDELQSPRFLEILGAITGVPHLEKDDRLIGGGLHATGRRGRLDVHSDFNYLPDVERFRRLNLLLYLNDDWRPEWGGELELWNEDVTKCELSVLPVLGRCVIFATTTTSFHGTTRIRCPKDRARYSLALYYYSHQPPPGFDDEFQGTVFKARPSERLKGRVLMPLEERVRRVRYRLQQTLAKRRRSEPDAPQG